MEKEMAEFPKDQDKQKCHKQIVDKTILMEKITSFFPKKRGYMIQLAIHCLTVFTLVKI